ncbi:hypothetical protein E8L99_13860 [Phreatobacter aquaticus]|uniref:EthD domain-containing protein n=1 Tax=Phreatobacter aquaticus TaxID=2570229 RepID=A0A4D7QIE5_9HYPH|nr:hypothetical protein [Phreatobacter aquaticus]QCK86765.1 hypothetical protein E8L99_13860 [Phreatobacter aquaticus]
MADPIFYVVEVDVPDAELPGFAAWYASVHAPHLYQAGFTACASYLAFEGGLKTVDVYQGPDWSLFETEAFARYRDIAVRDRYRPAFLASLDAWRTVYVDVPCATPAIVTGATPLDADGLSIWRFRGGDAEARRLTGWLEGEGAAALTALGAKGLRVLRRGRDTPTGITMRPDLALVVEWPARPPASVQSLVMLPADLAALMPDPPFTGGRLYPWAEDEGLCSDLVETVSGG